MISTAALLFALSLSAAADQRCVICTKSLVDMPVTMEKGTIRSAEFKTKHKQYAIRLQADRTIPDGELKCMMGIHHPREPDHCDKFGFHLALEAEWTVYADGQAVAHGIVQGKDDSAGYDSHHVQRYLGTFMGEKNKKYVLEITFSRDGTPLRAANPHIVVDLTPGSYM